MTEGEPDGATPLDPDERLGLKLRHVTTRCELDELEQANIEQGLAWLSRQRRADVLDDAFLRTLHERLFGDVWGWAGTYRRTEKNIGVDPLQIATQLRSLLDDARYWSAHDVHPPLEAAARYHHRLVQIHPFANGNGRHGRIATDVLLETVYRQPAVRWASGFDLRADEERREAYIAALRAADGGDLEPLLRFMGGSP